MTTLSPAATASPQRSHRAITPWRLIAWAWLVVVIVLGTVGFVGVYRDPALVRVPEFAGLYQPLGIPDVATITVLLALPLAFPGKGPA